MHSSCKQRKTFNTTNMSCNILFVVITDSSRCSNSSNIPVIYSETLPLFSWRIQSQSLKDMKHHSSPSCPHPHWNLSCIWLFRSTLPVPESSVATFHYIHPFCHWTHTCDPVCSSWRALYSHPVLGTPFLPQDLWENLRLSPGPSCTHLSLVLDLVFGKFSFVLFRLQLTKGIIWSLLHPHKQAHKAIFFTTDEQVQKNFFSIGENFCWAG